MPNIKNVTCDFFKILRRGRSQKVISLSLFGTKNIYYRHLKRISKLYSEFLPEWTIRIYFNKLKNESLICELECLKNENGKFIDNVDFCKVGEMPYGLQKTWDASYINPTMWRFLPLGDNFVDFYISRDTDSCPSLRELHSMNEWLKSENLFHIMRGNKNIS